MPKIFRLLFWLVLATAIVPRAEAADEAKRLALVIGNSTYEAAGGLPNAARDATAFGRFLSSQAFEVDVVTNASRRDMASAVSQFAKKVGPQDVALLYFAGHGMQLHGENYLVGTDAHLESELDVSAEAIALSDVIGSVEKKAKIALFFLDACRNNPLANRLNEQVEGVTRSLATRGLAPVNTEAAGTMVAFAAAPGQVAADGSGENSPFTTALIGNLAGPGLEIGTAFKRVIRDVRSTTAGKQSPQILSSLALEFYFNASLPVEAKSVPSEAIETPVQPATGADVAAVEVDFRKALRINTPRIWKFFLAKHKTGEQASMARQFLLQMQSSTTTTTKSLTPEQRENLLTQNDGKRREIQLALASKGFDPGTADGAFGQKTRNALSSYQKSIGIAPTGYVTDVTAEKLGLKLPQAQGEDGLYSSSVARQYKPEDFEGLETDPRVLKAVSCAPFFPKIYGRFQEHVYVLIKGSVTRNSASLMAKKCGGYLAAIGSAAENKFISSLMNGDQKLFSLYYDKKYGITAKMGAWIGLAQNPAAAEPKDGWAWENGQPLTYTSWHKGKPNEHMSGHDFGMFYSEVVKKQDAASVNVDTWDDMGPTSGTNSFVVEIE